MLGVMIDCSRNAVMNIKAVKQFVDVLAKMGYDTLMLYTEDTYEVQHQPFFGYMRGRYSQEEIREIDAYCQLKGIELIPCIQTLAHMNCMFQWWNAYEDIRDYDDILLIDEEKTYQLIGDMFASISECFTSKKLHIGMDEAFMVGLGKYLSKHGYENRFDLINRHLHRVFEMADCYGFKPMIWSDMFYKLASENDDVEEIRKRSDLPDNITLVHWDYYSKNSRDYIDKFETHKLFDREIMFAGGAWTWKGFVPDNQLSIDTTHAAMNACKASGITNVIMTVWGDDGGECSRFGVLPSLFYAAQVFKGNEDLEKIKKEFKEIVRMDFDSFMTLDKMNELGSPYVEWDKSPSKYLFYNDLFTGIWDHKVSGFENTYYQELKQKLDVLEVTEEYQLFFDYVRSLCDVLSIKSELGVRTRKAYQSGNRLELQKLAKEDYCMVAQKIKNFYKIYQKWWMSENKPQGFDIQDIRFGGLLQRIESCGGRLLSYCNDEIESIPELDETILQGDHGVSWARIVTPNVISHII